MANDIEFVDGLIVKKPHANAPDYVKANISIKVEDLGVWLRAKHKSGEAWVNCDVKVAKSGKWYCSVSTFKPKAKEEKRDPGAKPKDEEEDDGIPFVRCDLSSDVIFRKLRWGHE